MLLSVDWLTPSEKENKECIFQFAFIINDTLSWWQGWRKLHSDQVPFLLNISCLILTIAYMIIIQKVQEHPVCRKCGSNDTIWAKTIFRLRNMGVSLIWWRRWIKSGSADDTMCFFLRPVTPGGAWDLGSKTFPGVSLLCCVGVFFVLLQF